MEQLPQLSDEEFEQIEDAIARSAKGRAFLRRLHRRSLGAATEEVRAMLQEFRDSWSRQNEAVEAGKHVGVLRRELMEMAASIEQARREVAALRPPDGSGDKILSATNELDAIVISTERASFEILNAAERLMELAGKLRASGADPAMCGEIDTQVNDIFTACSFQDLTGQRTSKVVNALRYIEQRVMAMISIWGEDGLAGIIVKEEQTDTRPDAHLLNGPQLDGHGVSQADVDSMFDSPAPVPVAPPPPPPPPAPVQSSQADIDSMFDAPAPAAAPVKASQADIDSMFDSPAPAVASQSDIDSMFDAPAPTPAPAPAKKPVPKPPGAAPKPKAAAKPAPPPPPPAAAEPPVPLDQAAIDALFG
ncbi:chemotaxis regulatin CheY-phosphate phosphatase CheZ [Azospirillum lipoferum]|uniref:Protein phosphatase CheZ n=1 Tax=Azospirillum lipoferum TaxID=193 RepID=A0A5A9GVC9_AZOLI|nr:MULTISPECIES: protein phosphatase CheZ [Azospirillum]KAA0598428.1 protein phosphatase CheZ [Azospirillum lipoferum]MCP1609577.1 chemotaxis regulatin CheY-phosphate phosphatase CheZ [Azospirillum lipoferum]MDW5535114.1 protein phosphatase CheZ [Azospirillum sp. NL1]